MHLNRKNLKMLIFQSPNWSIEVKFRMERPLGRRKKFYNDDELEFNDASTLLGH